MDALFDVKVDAILFETFEICNIEIESYSLPVRSERGTSNEMKYIMAKEFAG